VVDSSSFSPDEPDSYDAMRFGAEIKPKGWESRKETCSICGRVELPDSDLGLHWEEGPDGEYICSVCVEKAERDEEVGG